MIQQGISQKHAADTLGCSRCAVHGLLDHHKGNTYMSATYPAFVGLCVPQLLLDRFGNLYATVSGAGPGLCVVDLDTTKYIAGFYVGVPRMKCCWPNVTVLYYNWDSTDLYVFLFKDKCKFNVYNISEVDVCFEKYRRIEARREVVSLSEVLCLRAVVVSCTWHMICGYKLNGPGYTDIL